MAEKEEREWRKKKTRTRTKSWEGESFVLRVCTRGWASFLVARGRARVCKNENVNGENFRLAGKSWLFFVASDSRAESKVSPLSPLLKSNNNAPNQRAGLIVINGRPRFPKKIHDNAIFISESGYIKGNSLISFLASRFIKI